MPISKSSASRLQREDLVIDLGLVAVAVLEDLEDGVAVALAFWSVLHCVDGSRAAAIHQHSGRLSDHRVAEPLERDSDVCGVPQERLSDFPREDAEQVGLQLGVR